MEWRMRRRAFLTAACGVIGARQAVASAYPNRGISLIIPFSAGTSVGINAQALQPYLELALGQRIEPIPTSGAGGAMGHLQGASAPADGYTITMVSESLAIQPWLIKASIVTPDAFTMIGQVTALPCVLLTRADGGPDTLGELVATLRVNPGSLTTGDVAGWPASSVAHAMFNARADIHPTVVSSFYRGADMLMALESGQLDFAMVGIQDLHLPLSSQRLRALGVSGYARSHVLPSVPTFREQGWDITNAWWRGLAVPKDTPARIVDTLGAALTTVLATPALQADFARNALSVDPLDGPTMQRRVSEEYQAVGRLFASLHINVRGQQPL
jgi:tripartite-type tricarboxylate transporter receptor subunit TctC